MPSSFDLRPRSVLPRRSRVCHGEPGPLPRFPAVRCRADAPPDALPCCFPVSRNAGASSHSDFRMPLLIGPPRLRRVALPSPAPVVADVPWVAPRRIFDLRRVAVHAARLSPSTAARPWVPPRTTATTLSHTPARLRFPGANRTADESAHDTTLPPCFTPLAATRPFTRARLVAGCFPARGLSGTSPAYLPVVFRKNPLRGRPGLAWMDWLFPVSRRVRHQRCS